jgi:hypothetical protein
MLTRPDVEALRAHLARAPAPGNMGRPNAVGAFFARWRQWQAEAHQLAAQLERALAEPPAGAPTSAPAAPGKARNEEAAISVFPRRPSPAEVRSVAAELTAERGESPSAPALVIALRARYGCSRATAYRALDEHGKRRARDS